MTFSSASLDWFLLKRAGHMGPDQYASPFGAQLWAASESETISATGNMVNAETSLLQKVVAEIGHYVPWGIAVVELGPGTVTAFKIKTIPIIKKLGSKVCVLVDESMTFLKQIAAASGLGKDIQIKPVEDDFFETEEVYFDGEALVCSFGSTISNFVGPISQDLPQDVLVNGLSKMAQGAKNGWMLIGFDSDHDGNRVKSFYERQALFQLNIFDRMAAELPIEGDFDPKAFGYKAEWIESSGQLAHVAIVNRDMNFKLCGQEICLKKGQEFHIKNSYKYAADFFEKCCHLAGLEVVKVWADDSPAKIYLLKILPRQIKIRPVPIPDMVGEELRVA